MKKILLRTAGILLIIYIIVCGLLFFFQEKLIFHPQKLDKDYKFSFQQRFEEINIRSADDKNLNGILFKADSSKGLIFYLHGNGGSADSWGDFAQAYTNLNYDVFILDYRGYGKSEGAITSESQFYQDLQNVYAEMKKRYSEEKIIVLGYSIGTGPAARLASENNPRLLILQAPYYSLTDMMKRRFPFVPTFILQYKFETYKYISACKMPVVIFHGNTDKTIYYNSSVKLRERMKNSDTLITLIGQGHNRMTDNPDYLSALKKILNP